jgi:hypothetical protein
MIKQIQNLPVVHLAAFADSTEKTFSSIGHVAAGMAGLPA